MDKVQSAGLIVFLLGMLLAFVLPWLGLLLLVGGLIIMFVSIIIERFQDIKKGDLT